MTDEHVLSGLLRKRAEVAGELEAAQATVRRLIIDLDAVDATIRLFQPNIDLEDIRPKPLPSRHAAYRGEVARIIFETLRDARRPMTTDELTMHVMAERDLNTSDKRLLKTSRSGSGRACGITDPKGPRSLLRRMMAGLYGA